MNTKMLPVEARPLAETSTPLASLGRPEMLAPKASLSLKLTPPLASRSRVEIGCACSPGAVVRMPVEGIYYETLPANLGPDADMLQAALLMSDSAPSWYRRWRQMRAHLLTL